MTRPSTTVTAVVLVAFTVGCFGGKRPIVTPTPPEAKDAQVEPIVNYYTIPLSTPAHIIICVQLPSFSHGHDNISGGGVACGFTVGELRELYIRQKKT